MARPGTTRPLPHPRHVSISWLGMLAVGTLLAFAPACKEDPIRPPLEGERAPSIGGGTGGGGGGVTDGGDNGEAGLGDGGTCTDLQNAGLVTDVIDVAGDFVGTGGLLTDGTYTIVQAQRYLGTSGIPGPSNTSYQGTIRITGTTFERVLLTTVAGVTGAESRTRGTITSSGTNAATIRITCPSVSEEPLTFSASESALTLSNTATKVTLTFNKRP